MQQNFLKIMLRLWSIMLVINLIGLQLTIAATTATQATSTTIETNLSKFGVEASTASTIHLRLHDNSERINIEQQTATTSTLTKSQTQQQLTKKEITSTAITPSITTLASFSNPVTTTNQVDEEMQTMPSQNQRENAKQQQPEFAQDKNVATTVIMEQYKNDDDKLKSEMKENNVEEVTETIQEERRQIAMDGNGNWQKETDTHKQLLSGNARITENNRKFTTTEVQTLSPFTTKTVKIFSPAAQNIKEDTTISPIEVYTAQPTPSIEEEKEIASENIKSIKLFNNVTPQPANIQQNSMILTPLQNTQSIEEFKPIIKDDNEELLKEHTIFSNKPETNNKEWKQNLMPNELEYEEHKPLLSKTYEHNINWSPYLQPATPVTDFTGKLLQEQDGVITDIEENFRLNEFVADNEDKIPTENPKTDVSYSVNHEILNNRKTSLRNKEPIEFIERRVKKSFDFPTHRIASDVSHIQQHFDFANTKFNSNNNEPSNLQTRNVNGEISSQLPRPQPEFSTTKFYNSKELYNEMLQHRTKQQHQQQQQPQMLQNNKFLNKDLEELNNRQPSLALNSFAVLHSLKTAKLEEIHDLKEPQQQQQQQKSLAIKKVTVKSTKYKDLTTRATNKATTFNTTNTISSNADATSSTSKPIKSFTLKATTTEMPSVNGGDKTKKFQKGLERAKLLIKSIMPLQNTTAFAITTTTYNDHKPEIKANKEETAATTLSSQTETTTTSLSSLLLSSSSTTRPVTYHFYPTTSTNIPKTSLHPIVRPRILSRLQEKINSLECEVQNLPQDSHLWRGNETHELLLPIMTPENCKTDKDCTAMMVSWEGEAEIQSGDILIVEINDALLTPKDINLTTSAHNTQVYQVTRSGHEHCDVTEGILLDITPLIVDGRKLVTLYDKDLTEGVNLLIVVSELWGSQCVRLKVTTKTENCGESADCSSKGICYSNYDMEEYECQCCSGFAGPHCEEIDACTPSPCTNNGICVDLSQGHEGNSYQCLCPYGYTGKNCQYELDPCNSAECMNGGSCVGNSTHFRCECTPNYTGPLCQHSLNECESSPCIHGICVDQEDGFRCFCQPGFAGELCNFEYNECESNPCQNGGECIDHIGSYECHCTKGYTGNRCQIKVDFCANKPCPEGRRCIDHGNDYSCECLGGRNGPDCNEMQRTQCNVNPCTHGGTCWSSGDSFYCACRPGYTGTMCEDEFVVETVVSSSEFMVDDTSARNFNDKSFGSSVVLKSPIELHNAYTAAIVLALVIFFVALYLTICHCKVNQTYRKFSTRTYAFLPIFGFRLRTKQTTSKNSRHWLSGKGLGISNAMRGATSALHATSSHRNSSTGHLATAKASSSSQPHQTHVGQLNERPFQRHLAMNLENDMYYTVDFSENSQHSPLIQ